MDSISVARALLLPYRSNEFLEAHQKKRRKLQDSATIGLVGFERFGIAPLAPRFQDLILTCCHLAKDKPTRLPGDYIFISNALGTSGPLEAVSAGLGDPDFADAQQHPNKLYTSNPTGSETVAVKLSVKEGTQSYIFDAEGKSKEKAQRK